MILVLISDFVDQPTSHHEKNIAPGQTPRQEFAHYLDILKTSDNSLMRVLAASIFGKERLARIGAKRLPELLKLTLHEKHPIVKRNLVLSLGNILVLADPPVNSERFSRAIRYLKALASEREHVAHEYRQACIKTLGLIYDRAAQEQKVEIISALFEISKVERGLLVSEELVRIAKKDERSFLQASGIARNDLKEVLFAGEIPDARQLAEFRKILERIQSAAGSESVQQGQAGLQKVPNRRS